MRKHVNELREILKKHKASLGTGVVAFLLAALLTVFFVVLGLTVVVVFMAIAGLITGSILYVIWNFLIAYAFESAPALSFLQCFALAILLQIVRGVAINLKET